MDQDGLRSRSYSWAGPEFRESRHASRSAIGLAACPAWHIYQHAPSHCVAAGLGERLKRGYADRLRGWEDRAMRMPQPLATLLV